MGRIFTNIEQHCCDFQCKCSSIYVIFTNILMIPGSTLYPDLCKAVGSPGAPDVATFAEQIRQSSKRSWRAALELLAPELEKRQPVETGHGMAQSRLQSIDLGKMRIGSSRFGPNFWVSLAL